MRRIALPPFLVALVALALMAGCEDPSNPMEPSIEVMDPNFKFIDGSSGGNPGVFFRVPLGYSWQRPGTFDPDVPLRIEIRKRGSSNVEVFSVAEGDIDVYRRWEIYSLRWRVPNAQVGDIFEVSVKAFDLELAHADLQITNSLLEWFQIRSAGENVGVFKFRRNIPIRLYINTDAVAEAAATEEEECLADGQVIDCDVEVFDSDDRGVVQVFDLNLSPAPRAAALIVQPGDVVDGNGNPVDEYLLTLRHLEYPQGTGPSPTLPTSLQFPYFVEGTITDGAGNPLFFQTGAEIILCQPPDFHVTGPMPEPEASYQRIFKVDGATTKYLTTLYGDLECEGYQPNFIPDPVAFREAPGTRLLQLAKAGLRSLGSIFLPQRAIASHGGLRSLREIGEMSFFGATLLTDPEVSSANPPAIGTVGETLTFPIQARLAPNVNQIRGGDQVQVTVGGQHTPGTLTVGNGIVDNGDGTYAVSFVPQVVGLATFAITIADSIGIQTPILGSPYGVDIASPFVLPVDVDGVRSEGEWDNAGTFQIGPEAGTLSNAVFYYQNDGTNLYLALAVPDQSLDTNDQFVVRFDNDPSLPNGQVTENGDDHLFLSGPGGPGFRDAHYSGAAQGWGFVDTYPNGSGAAGGLDGVNFFEMEHPLSSGDPLDIAVGIPGQLGVCFRYSDQGSSSGDYPAGCMTEGATQALYALISILGPID